MSDRSNAFPLRVVLIAAGITVALAFLLVAVNRLGRPAEPPARQESVAGDVIEAPDQGSIPVEGEEPLPSGESPAPADGTDPRAVGPIPLADAATEDMTLQLFVIDSANRRLVPAVRRVEAPRTPSARARAALEYLKNARGSPLPPDTVIREVWVSDAGIAYVDFGAGFPGNMPQGSMAEIHAVYGVVGTLTASFPQISAVQFLVSGQPVDTLTGHVDLSRPVEPLADWVF